MKKLNISGGEPFLKPTFIGEVFRFCKEELHLESCSVVNNGSKVTEKWLDTYGRYLDMMAISCDSFDAGTNVLIGRSDKARSKGNHISRVFEVAEWCRQRGIKVKINSVINIHNWLEDMNESITALAPSRWKVFQVLLLDGENTGDGSNSLRDGRELVITDKQFEAFMERHKEQKSLVPENNEAMKDSYLNLDEHMRFLNCETGGKVPGRSLLEVGVQNALKDAGWDKKAFEERGGIFDWSRDMESLAKKSSNLDW
ncbi:radical SAM enzyme [Pholiota conissans]|uniref:Radical SAM enzyme n=1 Tax=Pholiota conissans TaxID=109636 RepID=A0A9P6CQF4_9AGAR|nr:radical SAM enzyme [Pholiota conissans]